MANNSHYKQTNIEPLAVIESYGLGFVLGNVIKYVLRHPHKGGVDDLHKALWYLAYHISQSNTKADEVLRCLTAATADTAVQPPADATKPKQVTKMVTIAESLQYIGKALGQPENGATKVPIVAEWQPIKIQMQRDEQ